MYPYIVCWGGHSIGHLYDAFELAKRKYIMAQLGPDADPDAYRYDSNTKLSLKPIFDAFQLPSCCALRLMTQEIFVKHL